VKRALRSAALRPFSLLTIDRLLHLLQGADYLFKLDEFTFLPWDSFVLPRGAAFVTGGDLEQSMAALKEPAAEASEMELELGRRLARRAVVFRHLDPKRMQERATERMGFAVRTDNIRALRCKSLRAGEPDEVLLLEGEADEADGFHEFVHHIQEERHGPSWIAENLMAAEMEAHARELNLRRRFGNSRLYDDIARLSPFGFEMGLRLYVEQVYFRLAEMPGIVS
jgi:hypothetical protein